MISVTYNHSYGYWDHCQKGIFSADWGWTQSVNSVILVAWPRGKCLGQLLLDLLQLVWQYHNLLVLLLMRFNWIVRVRNSWEFLPGAFACPFSWPFLLITWWYISALWQGIEVCEAGEGNLGDQLIMRITPLLTSTEAFSRSSFVITVKPVLSGHPRGML